MNWFLACEFCDVDGERGKTLPFGNPEGEILFVIPGYLRLSEEAQREYCEKFPDAFFVAFTACAGVEDVQKAEMLCSVLLRNVARPFYKILISDYEPLRKVFGVGSEGAVKEDGTQIAVYRGLPLEKSAKEEYKRLTHG